MSASPRIVSLNLGSQTVGLAEFRTQPNGGLMLMGYRLREILGEHGNEGARNAQITAAVAEMMGEMGIKTGAVNYGVPAQSIFARFVKLPAVEEEKIERIIAFEAQQNVPFPLEEVVWDYQLAGGGGDVADAGVPTIALQLALVMELVVVPLLFAWQRRIAWLFRS